MSNTTTEKSHNIYVTPAAAPPGTDATYRGTISAAISDRAIVFTVALLRNNGPIPGEVLDEVQKCLARISDEYRCELCSGWFPGDEVTEDSVCHDCYAESMRD